MTGTAPKLFISYSWTSEAHQEWVISLATELRESGVDVILDKWDLKEGNDAYAFMEKMVTDPEVKKVALICDKVYSEKADGRSGGVGAETQIISAEVYSRQDQSKFVAVIAERDENGNPFLPTYYKSRIYIDLSSSDSYANNLEQLLRWVFDKPLHLKPALGKKPAFLQEGATPSLETTYRWRRALDAIRQDRPYSGGALIEYLDLFGQNMENFRITKNGGEFDDKVIQNIEEFLPYRNEAIELFLILAQYRHTQETWESLHRFFERLLPYLDHQKGVRHWQEWDFDNFRFIVHELFLYAITALLRHERFPGVSYLISQYYYQQGHEEAGLDPMVSFSDFKKRLACLEHRNTRLNLHRLSLHADLLEQRSRSSGLPFRQVMQADFILFIRDCLDCLRHKRRQKWFPITLLYASDQYAPFEIFARCISIRYFDKAKEMFEITKKEDLIALAEAYKKQELIIPRWDFETFDPINLINLDKLATLP